MTTFRVSNRTPAAFTFTLEPWGGKYTVQPGASLLVKFESPSPPQLEWEVDGDDTLLIVHGPAGTDATVFDDDRQVIAR